MNEVSPSLAGYIKEREQSAHQRGYDKGLKDALITIINLLKHNNIRMKSKEFWAEYKNLLNEGVIK